MIDINFGDLGRPKFTRPEILNNEVIPLCLAGVNPRTLMGESRWRTVRIKAYEENNRCCWACGNTPGQDKFVNHLEAHERYIYDTGTCCAELQEVVALCRTCHYFVHIGRTVTKTGLVISDLEYIMKHGLGVLNNAKLAAMPHIAMGATLFFSPAHLEELYPHAMGVSHEDVMRYYNKKMDCDEQWVLLFEGKAYRANARTGKPKEVKRWKPRKRKR